MKQQWCYTTATPTLGFWHSKDPKHKANLGLPACIHWCSTGGRATPSWCTAAILWHSWWSSMQDSALRWPGWGCLLELLVCAVLRQQIAQLKPLLPVQIQFLA